MSENSIFIIDTKECLLIAQKVYNEYVEAMEPPLYIFMSFPEWLSNQLKACEGVTGQTAVG